VSTIVAKYLIISGGCTQGGTRRLGDVQVRHTALLQPSGAASCIQRVGGTRLIGEVQVRHTVLLQPSGAASCIQRVGGTRLFGEVQVRHTALLQPQFAARHYRCLASSLIPDEAWATAGVDAGSLDCGAKRRALAAAALAILQPLRMPPLGSRLLPA